MALTSISIHAPARGATGEYNTRDDGVVISIHAPARGATVLQGLQPKRAFDFNPRPREGGDHDQKYQQGEDEISIHAPARGATQRIQPGTAPLMISIHAPARGATACVPYITTQRLYFNPRPREGGDSKDAQFYLRIFDKQVELLRFWGKMRGGCLRNPEKDRRFLGKSLANLPEISGHLDFAGA